MALILLMEKILHHLGCPKSWLYTSIKTFWGIPSGAGIFPSTVFLFDEFSKSSFSSHFRVSPLGHEFLVAIAPKDYDRVAILDVGRSLQKVVLQLDGENSENTFP